MRLQFATFESLLSLSFSLSLLCAIAYCISGYTTNFYMSNRELIWSYAVYDFVHQASRNASMGACVSSFITNNSSCMTGYLDEYSGIYGLRGFSLTHALDSRADAPVSGSMRSCFPFRMGHNYTLLCLEADV